MTTTRTNFYVTGGTLEGDALSYVHRQADEDLYAGLTAGEFCYVLTPRQMGKSSLMVRTAARLRAEGVVVVKLDLTKVGRNLTVEQWYFGLLERIGTQTGFEKELEEFWRAHEGLGPLQRLTHSLQEVVLKRIDGRLVVFVDEIDYVRSLPFSADEFFAAIREFYNGRAAEPELTRLTVCLLGVATPSDLIRDARTTPFNIGRRIELTDFSEAEAAPLTRGLGRDGKVGARMLKRVLDWTGGHPYLTQRLCRAVAEDAGTNGEGSVDDICSELFLSPGARERDDNLHFVSKSILRGEEVDRVGLLDLYQKIRGGKRVPDDETNRLVSVLRLSGVTRVVGGLLRVRNRIYHHTFDDDWVMSNMPDAEARRQRAAFRKGARRTALIAAVILIALTALTLFAVIKSKEADAARAREAKASEFRRRLLYDSEMNVAQLLWEYGKISDLRGLLTAQIPKPGEPDDLRSFEWFYMWRLAQNHQTLEGNNEEISHLALSPDTEQIVTVSEEGAAIVWDARTGSERFRLIDDEYDEYTEQKAHKGDIASVTFSPDGGLIVTGGADQATKVWDAGSGKRVFKLGGHAGTVNCAALTRGGRRAVTGSDDTTAKIWDVRAGKVLHTLTGHRGAVTAAAITPDGRRVVTGSDDKTAKIWDADTGRLLHTLGGHTYKVHNVDFSPDGKRVVTANYEDSARVWDVETGRGVFTLGESAESEGHGDVVINVSYTPDGKRIITGSEDNTTKVWDAETGKELLTFERTGLTVESAFTRPDGSYIAIGFRGKSIELWDTTAGRESLTLKGHEGPVYNVAFSPDSKRIATASPDKTAKIWDAATGKEIRTLKGHEDLLMGVAFSPDGTKIITGSKDKTARVWNAETGDLLLKLDKHTELVWAVAFSPDGKRIATASTDATAKIWDAETGEEIRTLAGHNSAVVTVAFSNDGRYVVTGSFDNTAKIWDAATGKEIRTLAGHENWIVGAAFSPDGKYVVTGSADKTANIWDVSDGRVEKMLIGYSDIVNRVAYSPDGKRILTSNSDNTAQIWDVLTGRATHTFRGHTGNVTSVAFSPDGRRIVTGSDDQTAKVWELDVPER